MTPEEFRELRKRLGLNQTQLAAEWGTTARSVRRWEAGETPIQPVTAYCLRMMVKNAPKTLSDAEVEAILNGGFGDDL